MLDSVLSELAALRLQARRFESRFRQPATPGQAL